MTTPNLDDYLTRAANRPPSYSKEALDELLRLHDEGMLQSEPESPASIAHWGVRVAAVAAGISLLVLVGFVLRSGGYLNGDEGDGGREGIGSNEAVGFRPFSDEDVDVTAFESYDPESLVNPARPYLNRVSIGTIHLLHLTPQELADIGARSFDEGRVEYFYLQSNGRWSAISFTMTGAGIDYRKIDDGIRPTPRRFRPTLITDPMGRRRSYTYTYMGIDTSTAIEIQRLEQAHYDRYATDIITAHDSIAKQVRALMNKMDTLARIKSSRINDLIGIYVETGRTYTPEDSLAKKWHPDCILWYEPTPEFLALLPDRYRNKITPLYADISAMLWVASQGIYPPSVEVPQGAVSRDTLFSERVPNTDRQPNMNQPHGQREDRSLQSRASTSTPRREESSSIDNAVTGAPTGLQQSTTNSGAILRAFLGVNPAASATTLEYTLSEPRRLTLSLHTIDGRQLQNVVESANYNAGSGTISIDLHGFSAGMYLVALTSDRGEQLVMRLLIL